MSGMRDFLLVRNRGWDNIVGGRLKFGRVGTKEWDLPVVAYCWCWRHAGTGKRFTDAVRVARAAGNVV